MGRRKLQKIYGMNSSKQTLNSFEERSKTKICVIKCNEIGLSTACLLAEAGFKVIGADKNIKIIETIKSGKSPFHEQGLEDLVSKNVKNGRLAVSTNIKQAVFQSDVIIIVDDILVDKKGRPDYSKLERTCREIGKALQKGTLVIMATIVGPGVTETLVKNWVENSSGLKAGTDFGLAFSSTEATVGRILHDISHNPRLVAGINNESLKAATLIFSSMGKSTIIPLSSIKAAETACLFQNVYRDVVLALSNELAVFCEKAGIDYAEVYKAANANSQCRLFAPEVTSKCAQKIPYLLLKEAEDFAAKLRITRLAREVNENMVKHVVKLVRKALKRCEKPLRGSRITIFGISCKANIKTSINPETVNLVKTLESKGAKIKVYDPFFSKKELSKLGCPAENSWKTAIKGADCLLITIGHDYFKKISLENIKVLMKSSSVIVDLSRILDPEEAEETGILLISLGRG